MVCSALVLKPALAVIALRISRRSAMARAEGDPAPTYQARTGGKSTRLSLDRDMGKWSTMHHRNTASERTGCYDETLHSTPTQPRCGEEGAAARSG
jgi:hypothetical protein